MLLFLLLALVGRAAFAPASARADAFGQIGRTGSFGTGAGMLHWPGDLAVDPSDNSVYVLDEPEGSFSGAGPTSFRIQKFAAGLTAAPTATITVPTPPIGGELQGISGIAVDPVLHRLYVLKTIEDGSAPAEPDVYVGSEIDAYSTQESAGTLPLAPEVETGGKKGVAYKFPAPPTSLPLPAGTLGTPRGLAIDPADHSLVALGADASGATVVQRIGLAAPSYATGTLAATFDDTSHEITASGFATGIAVGPDGSVYLNAQLPPHGSSAAVMKLASNFTTVSTVHVDGTAEPIELTSKGAPVGVDYGPQMAVSPDGGLVYAFETDEPEIFGNPRVPGSYEIRGMSTTDGTQQVVFGGAPTTASSCLIASKNNAVAAGKNGVVYALDEGEEQPSSENEGHTTFGFHLIEFGPGGSGCPAPTTSFTINEDSSSAKVRVEKGEVLTLRASSAELKEAKPKALEWQGEGPEAYPVEVVTAGCPSTPETCLKTTHRFLKAGLYVITLKMQVTSSPLGPPAAVKREVEVFSPPPTASFSVSVEAPQSGEVVRFDGSGSLDPTGSANGTPTHKLKSYTWSFGDGTTETTGEPEFSRSFANAGTLPRSETVALTVTDEEGVQSAPSPPQTLTIQPVSGGGGGGGGGGVVTNPLTPLGPVTQPGPAPKPPPAIVKPLSNAQKLAKALKTCKKLKAKGPLASCEKKAKKKYAAKAKKKKKK